MNETELWHVVGHLRHKAHNCGEMVAEFEEQELIAIYAAKRSAYHEAANELERVLEDE